MLRAIAIKELRETWWIAVLPAVILFLIVLNALGLEVDDRPPFAYWRMNRNPGWVHPVPFSGDPWPLTVLVLGGIAGVGMALWQTLVESAQGTWTFFLHRPAGRRSLVLAKLGIGLGAVLVCVGLPLLFYALWAATPGTHANPFEWWMVGPTLRAWAYMSVAYLAAFLCGVRPARWWVSRFFPAVLPLCAWLPIVVVPWTAWPMWLVIGMADAVLLGAILWVTETRDWA